ncbi:MAG: helix-turn-helix domain-containing protein [Lachnospiraceae bacterium]|nr:helix-turn-helix domain-containing protein [Lachnospiraceae bacterium]
MGFGENLQKLRKERNISQESLAEELKVSRQTIGKWENGVTYPEVECLIQISDFFEVSIDTLLKGTVGEPVSSDTNEQEVFRETEQQRESAVALRQKNRNIRFVIAIILFIISPFYPGSPGANSIGGFLMTLSIAVGIGLLIYNHKTKDQAE